MERHPKVNPPDYTNCPHCGNYTLHKLQYRDDYYEPYVDVEDLDHKWYALLRCTTCNKPSLYRDFWDEENGVWISKLAYPLPPLAPKEVPKDIRDAFNEAVSVLQNSPSLCAVGIRRCLEGVCSDQNASGHTLQDKISFLGNNGIIPSTLTDMMDLNRIIGNIGAHFSPRSVTIDDAKAMIEFTIAIFEYIYVAPSKVNAVRNRLKNLKSQS